MTKRKAQPGNAGRRLLFCSLAAVAFLAALALLPRVQAQTHEGLQNPGLEGAASANNGFQLSYNDAVQVTTGCPTSPAPAPQVGLTRGGSACAVNLGAPGPTTDWAAVSSIKAYPAAVGNRLADMVSISAFQNVPNGLNAQELAAYQMFYRIDTNEDSAADVCIVQTQGFPKPPVGTGTAGWQQMVFSSSDASIKFVDRDINCSACVSSCTDLTQSEVQTRYPTARIMAIYIQLVHNDWDPGTAGYPPWPAGYPVYLDDLSLTMNNAAGVLLAVGDGVTVNEAGPISDTYQITLSSIPAAGETVTVTPSESTGGGPNQVTLSPASVTFTSANWNVPKTVTVTAIDDTIAETEPHYTTIAHTASSSAPLSGYNSVVIPSFQVTIHDNDVAGVSSVPGAISLREADPATTATYNVQLGSQPSPGETVTVVLTPDVRETVDTDPVMAGNQNTLTFTSAGPLSKPVKVSVVDDAVDQADVVVEHIKGAVSSNLPSSPYATTTMPDEDVAVKDNDPLVTIAATTSADENGPTTGTFTVTRGPDLSRDVSVDYTVGASSTATSGVDYTALYAGPKGTIVILAGSATATISVVPIDDAVDEPTETVVVSLVTTLEPYTASGASATATLNLLDNDNPSVSLSASASAASETGPTTGTFTMTRSGADLPIDVPYALSGSAASGSDYSLDVASPVHFNAGQTTRTLTLTPVDDAIYENPETAILTMTGGAAYSLAGPASATITIADNDGPTVTVAATTPSASEVGPVSGVFTVTRDKVGLPITVSVQFSGTATGGSDYPTPPTTIAFTAAQSSATYTVVPAVDGVDEAPETVVLTLLSGPSYALGATTAASVSIADGDKPVVNNDSLVAYRDCLRTVAAPGVLGNDPVPPSLSYTAVPASGATAQAGSFVLLSDGSFAYKAAPGYTGSDSFTYRDNDGTFNSATATVGVTVSPNTLPAARFSVVPASGTVGNRMVFFDRSSDSEGSLTTWGWDFGDGNTGSGPMPSHSYWAVGTYSVRLAVTDGQCGTATSTQTLTVSMPPPNAPPADPTASDDSKTPPKTAQPDPPVGDAGPAQMVDEGSRVTLFGLASGTGTLSFQWQQLDGPMVTLSNAKAAQPTFTAPPLQGGPPATLHFSLVVTQGQQTSQSTVAAVTVGHANRAPVVVALGGQAMPGATFMLDASGSQDADGDPLTYVWSQWTGPTVTLSDPTSSQPSLRMPDAPGTLMTFTVEVSDGRASTLATAEVKILPASPSPDFSAVVGPDGTVQVTPTAPAAAFTWDFGDSSPAVLVSGSGATSHHFVSPGTYTVSLKATAIDGSTSSVQKSLDFQPVAQHARPAQADASTTAWVVPASLVAAGLTVVIAILLLARLGNRRARN